MGLSDGVSQRRRDPGNQRAAAAQHGDEVAAATSGAIPSRIPRPVATTVG